MKVIKLIGRALDARRTSAAGSRGGDAGPRGSGPGRRTRDPLDHLPLHYAECYLGRKELQSLLQEASRGSQASGSSAGER